MANKMMNKSMIDSILIIIVIYEIKLDESLAFRSLTEALMKKHQSASLFIYDNSLQPQQMPESALWTISYCHNLANPGVGKAYNQGFIMTKETGKKWMRRVDHDQP